MYGIFWSGGRIDGVDEGASWMVLDRGRTLSEEEHASKQMSRIFFLMGDVWYVFVRSASWWEDKGRQR